ncbi:hypothetical protein D3C72_2561000 [compost metagenome]
MTPEAITTIGAIIGNIPVVAGLDRDPTLAISTGDFIEMDADAGIVAVTTKETQQEVTSPASAA